MTNKEKFRDFKIEFRAVPYGSEHVLEWRISPDQNITYEKEVKILGLFKIKRIKKYDTKWHQPLVFTNYPSAYLYSKESGDPYLPIFVRKKKDLEEIKRRYKTYGEFFDHIDEYEAKEEAEWRIQRDEYLDNHKVWE